VYASFSPHPTPVCQSLATLTPPVLSPSNKHRTDSPALAPSPISPFSLPLYFLFYTGGAWSWEPNLLLPHSHPIRICKRLPRARIRLVKSLRILVSFAPICPWNSCPEGFYTLVLLFFTYCLFLDPLFDFLPPRTVFHWVVTSYTRLNTVKAYIEACIARHSPSYSFYNHARFYSLAPVLVRCRGIACCEHNRSEGMDGVPSLCYRAPASLLSCVAYPFDSWGGFFYYLVMYPSDYFSLFFAVCRP